MFQNGTLPEKWLISGATCDTFFLAAVVLSTIYINQPCLKLDVTGGRPTSSWPTLMWRGTGPRKVVCVCVGLLASSYEGAPGTIGLVNRLESGRGHDHIVSLAPIWLSLFASCLAYSLGHNKVFQNQPRWQGLAKFYSLFSPHVIVKIEPDASPWILVCASIVV